jgi:hypothetical protein
VAVDVTGLPMGALVLPASTHENRTGGVMLGHLNRQGVTELLEWSWWTVASPQPRRGCWGGGTASGCAGSVG